MEKVYQPEHPLPDEIRTMLRCETICQFCGVSYLIHSEIKRLQYELEECKKEVYKEIYTLYQKSFQPPILHIF